LFKMLPSTQFRTFNYIVEIENNEWRDYILEIRPDNPPNFSIQSTQQFSGEIYKISFENAFGNDINSQKHSSRFDDDAIVIYCWKLLFENGKNMGYFPTNDGGSGGPIQSGGGGGGGSEYIVIPVGCGCAGHMPGVPCRCSRKAYYKIVKKNKLKENSISGSRNDYEECGRLLLYGGFMLQEGGGTGSGQSSETEKEKTLEEKLSVSQECLNKLDKFAKFELAKIVAENNYIAPCDPSKTSEELLGELLNELCINTVGKITKDDLYKALDGVDFIDDHAISGNNCPCVNSIWEQIKSQTATSEFGSSGCSVLELLSDYLEGPLQAEIGISTLNFPETTNAVAIPNTTNVGNGNELLLFNTRIEINPNLCGGSIDKDPLEIAGMLLHELIHARIFESLYNRGYFGQLAGGTENFNVRWNNFIQSNYPNIVPVGYDQHKLMAQSYVNDLAQALHDLNGGVGEPSDYLLIAWQGLLGAYPEETRHLYDFLPNIKELQDSFNNNVKGQGSLQFNGCN
jgi:hypothetical protein